MIPLIIFAETVRGYGEVGPVVEQDEPFDPLNICRYLPKADLTYCLHITTAAPDAETRRANSEVG